MPVQRQTGKETPATILNIYMSTQKTFIFIILILSFYLLPKYAVGSDSDFIHHALFPISHANIFHLAGNLLCLWLFKIKLHLPVAVVVSFVCSYLPQFNFWGMEPFMGFSGILFAIIGIMYGERNKPKRMFKYCIVPVIITGLFPHVCLSIHLYCLLAGFAYGYVLETYLIYKRI